jgi:hypothetical protein
MCNCGRQSGVLPLKGVTLSAFPRIVSVSVAWAAAIGLIAGIGIAPPAYATPCEAPDANIDPPASAAPVPAPAPVVRPPTGRRPSNTNDRAPLPKLGPLISSLLKPGTTRYSAPLQNQARVTPRAEGQPPPNPPQPGVQPPPNATQLRPNPAPNAAPQPPPHPAPQPAPEPGPPPASIAGAPTSLVDWVTGINGPNKTLERFGISGTDLGIAWDNGDPANHQVLMAFGDTFGYCKVHGQQWRYNTLFRSADHDLSHGIHVAPGSATDKFAGSPSYPSGLSRQIIHTMKRAPHETGIIPTAAISIGKTQLLNFMSIRDWVRDGDWRTNFSAIALSRDNGQTWGVYPGTIRPVDPDSVPGSKFVPGNENFQMGAFMKGNDGYLYSFGTPAGRGGAAHLSRVPPQAVPDLSKYEYWNGDGEGRWVPNNPAAATPVIPGPVAEMSAQYNSYLKQYLALYTNGANDVVARTAPAPQGPWSPEQLLVSSFQMPGGIYAPMIHPWSSGRDLYFNLSLWSAYDVMLMHTVLP